jgi:inosine-uridine nucleoside N-ribohydrolase
VTRVLVLDCDPGIDDMVAILVACTTPGYELRAVTTVGGNAGLEATTRNACQVLELAGRADVPVAAGANQPLVHPAARNAEDVHGATGLGGMTLPPPRKSPEPGHAVDLLAKILERETVTLVATGPLTNIALLFALRPELMSNVERLVVMGGSIGRGNVTPAAEFNIWFDPEAAQRVLSTREIAKTMVGLDVTMATTFTPEQVDRARRTGPVGAQVAAGLDFYEQRYRAMLGRPVIPVHDAVAVVAATRPDLVTTQAAMVTVDTGYGPSRGNTLVNLDQHEDEDEDDMQVALEADKSGVLDYILERIAVASSKA